MSFLKKSFLTLALALALFSQLDSCKKKPAEQVPTKGEARPAEAAQFTAKDIRPAFYVDGIPNALPHFVRVVFPRAVVNPDVVGKEIDKDTVIKIDPEVKGVWTWTNQYTLEFLPKDGFPHERSVKVSILKLNTMNGVMEPPERKDWERTFDTPAFDLRRIELADVDFGRFEVKVQITFSGPVSLDSVKQRLRLSLGAAKSLDYSLSLRDPETVIVQARSSQLLVVRKLIVTITPGVRSLDGNYRMNREAREEFTLVEPEHLTVKSAAAREGESGFYIEVVCEDEANKRTYWSYSDYEYVRACNIQPEGAQDYVQVNPPVKVSVSAIANGMRIFGEFKRGGYNLVINSGLRSVQGGMLTTTYETTVSIPARSPKISFLSKGRYLPRSYVKTLPVSHVNVPSVEVSVRQIFDQNLVFWLSSPSESADDRTSDLVGSKTFKLEGRDDEKTTSWLDLAGLIPEKEKGVFELTLKAEGKTDTARLILSDIALVTKRAGEGGRDFELWAFNVQDLKPMSGVKVELITESNRVLASCATDGSGACRFQDVADPLKQKQPFALIARAGEDLIALRFSDLVIPTGDFDAQGAPFRQQYPYRAAIYSDRGVYRPGETARLVAIVRDENNLAPKQGVPAIGRVLDPRKKQVLQLRATTNPAGMAAFDLPFQAFAATGKYTFELDIAANSIASYDFNVEEFVPERMKVNLATDKSAFLQSETVPVKIEAKYLFGAVASGEKVELSCVLEEGAFKPGKNENYAYSVWRKEPFKPVSLATVSGELDDKGLATLECPALETRTAYKGPGRLMAQASVFEAGSGRTTVNRLAVPVHPDQLYIGLATSETQAQPGKQAEVKGVVVDWDGNLAAKPQKIEITLVRLEPEWVWEYDPAEGRESYQRYTREIEVSKQVLDAQAGQFQFSFKPEDYSAGFVVRAKTGERAQTDLFIPSAGYYDEYWEPYVSEISETPKPMRPETIRLDAPARIKVGETAKAVVNSPYKGRMLFTVETDQIIQSGWSDVSSGPVNVSFKVDRFYPNVYVSALVIKDPHLESEKSFMPARAFGLASVAIVPEKNQMKISVACPAEVKPNEKLVVSLDVGSQTGPVFATVAAVDEGILQLTRFPTPDPLAILFAKRSLGVQTFDTIGWTLMVPPIASQKSPGGGEGEAEAAAGRVQPVKPVALWSGVIAVPASGKVEIKLEVPQYRGKLRVMAVAANAERVGAAEASVIVRDPLVLQTTFPRFLIGNDRFVVPVFITNMTGKAGLFSLSFNVGEELSVEGGKTRSINLDKNQSGVVTFVAKAMRSMGAAQFEVTAKGNGATSKDNAQIPFLPDAPVTRESTVVQIQPGKNSIMDPLEGWAPQYEKTTVWLTSSKYSRELSHLKWLIQYPYGCIEQTTSFTRPLLYIGNLLYYIDPEAMRSAGIEDKFMHGANRLLSMQTEEGGFSYWPGARESTFWGTAYATHCLMLGKDQGYPIPQDRLDDAVSFMENALNGNLNRTDGKYGYTVAKSEPYMQYVLALNGKARKGRIKQLIDNPNPDWGELQEENLYLLKAALYLSGDRSYEKDLKSPLSGKVSDRRANDWGFWSELRTKGMILDVMEELFPGSKEAEPLADLIAGRLRQDKGQYGFTTQELSWCVSALGKRASTAAKSWSNPELLLNGKAVAPEPKPPKAGADTSWVVSGASGARSLEVKVDKIEGGNLFALVTVEGIKPGVPYDTGDHSIQARRRYLYGTGEEADLNNLRLGDVIYVELSLQNQTGSNILNVLLNDRFPAGLEIENPRLNRQHVADWMDQAGFWDLSYIDMRDDQITMFGHLEAKQQVKAVYVLRAVTAGEFSAPPVKAEAMYDPRIWSQSMGKPVRIIDPWKALIP